MSKKTYGFVLGAMIGAASAAATALLLAPKSGKELREDLMAEADRVKGQMNDYSEIALEKGAEFSEVAKNATEDIRVNLKESVSQLKDSMTNKVASFKNEDDEPEEIETVIDLVDDVADRVAEEIKEEIKEEINE